MIDKSNFTKTARGTYTYFITDGQKYKIGKSKDVKSRMATYGTHSTTIEFLGACPENIESDLHEKYKEFNYVNEWFDFPKDVTEEVKKKHFPLDKIEQCPIVTKEVFDKRSYDFYMESRSRHLTQKKKTDIEFKKRNNHPKSAYSKFRIDAALNINYINEWEADFFWGLRNLKTLSKKQLELSRKVLNKINACKNRF